MVTIEERNLLVHTLATLVYRTERALEPMPDRFMAFRPAAGVRSPEELLAHMADLLEAAAAALRGRANAADAHEGAWDRFRAAARDLARVIGEHDLKRETAFRLLQGPLLDAVTHAGQLALLRRMAGSPIPAEDFFAADIGTAALEP